MLEYKKDTFDMFMDILDNIGSNYNSQLKICLEICKHRDVFRESTIEIDKALILRFKCNNTDNYKLVLEMFKFIEEFIIKK